MFKYYTKFDSELFFRILKKLYLLETDSSLTYLQSYFGESNVFSNIENLLVTSSSTQSLESNLSSKLYLTPLNASVALI